MVLNCVVVGCTRSQYQLEKWKARKCDLHGCNYGMGRCVCPPPFKLHTFPTQRHHNERKIWIKNIKGKNKDGSKWEPKSFHRVCSQHFKDGQPTSQHPYPTENLGITPYNQITYRPSKIKQENLTASDHTYSFVCKDCSNPCSCEGCALKQNTIEKLQAKIDMLESEINLAQLKKLLSDSVFQQLLKENLKKGEQ